MKLTLCINSELEEERLCHAVAVMNTDLWLSNVFPLTRLCDSQCPYATFPVLGLYITSSPLRERGRKSEIATRGIRTPRWTSGCDWK